jgi:hypothetical protein
MHTKYLKRFNNKIQLMHTHIMNDIKLEESIEMTNEKKAEILNEFNINGADQELLENLKKTINSETSSENGDEIRSKSNSFDIKETKENIVLIKTEPEPELELQPEQEDAKNNEDNESVVSSEPVKEEPKKKRTYKPRKK